MLDKLKSTGGCMLGNMIMGKWGCKVGTRRLVSQTPLFLCYGSTINLTDSPQLSQGSQNCAAGIDCKCQVWHAAV